MSNTARKIRRRRHNLIKQWDLIATKALLLGDNLVEAARNNISVTVDGGKPPARIVHASYWMLEQMNIKPTSKARERFRAALQRLHSK